MENQLTISEADFRAAIIDAASASREATQAAVLDALVAFEKSGSENLNNSYYRAGVNAVIELIQKVMK